MVRRDELDDERRSDPPDLLLEVLPLPSRRRALGRVALSPTDEPEISKPLTVPLPCVAVMLLAVTTPPNSDTDPSVTCAVVHAEPPALEERKRTIGALVG